MEQLIFYYCRISAYSKVFNALKGILGIPICLNVPVKIKAIFLIALKFKRSYLILIDDGIAARLFDTGRLRSIFKETKMGL